MGVVAVAGGGDATSSLLRTSEVSTSTSKVMAQEDEDSFNIVSMDGSTESTQKPNKRKREVYIGAAYGAVAGGGDTTSSLLRTSAVSTSTSKVMAQEDEDTINIVSNMDGSSKSTHKPNKRKGATLEVFSL